MLWSSSDYEVAQVQISLILHFIPYNTTDLPCGLCSVTCKFIFYFHYLWNQGSSWLFNVVDIGRRILILEKRGHTWWPSRIRMKSMKGQKGTNDRKKREVYTEKYWQEAGVELQEWEELFKKWEERRCCRSKKERKWSANESSDLEKGGLSQGVGRKQRDGIRKRVCSVHLAL